MHFPKVVASSNLGLALANAFGVCGMTERLRRVCTQPNAFGVFVMNGGVPVVQRSNS